MSLGTEGATGAATTTDGGAGNVGAGGAGTAGGSTGAGAGSGGSGTGDKGAVGEGAAGTKSWRDTLPDDIKSDPTLSKYSDVANLSKAHIELQKKFGQKGVFKPGKDASAEEIKAFREQMGIPTSPDKYDLGELKADPKIVEWAKKVGSEQGIEPAALKNVISNYMEVEAANKTAADAAKKAEIKEGFKGLRGEWGESFDKNLQRANFAAQKLGGEPLIAALKKYGADNDPVILKVFAEAAKLYGEDKLREAGAGNGAQTSEELDAQISQVRGQMMAMKPTDGAYASLRLRHESLWKQKTQGK